MTPGLNLESCSNQLSKFGELSKSALQIWQLSDSQKCPHNQSRDSWLTPNRFHSLISDRHISNPKAVSKKFIRCWQQVSMLRAVQINSQNSSQYLWMKVLFKSLFGFLNNWKTLGMLLLFYNIPYFRKWFPRKLFFFEVGLMYCDLWWQYIKVRKLFAEIRYMTI